MKIESEHSTENSLCTPIFYRLKQNRMEFGLGRSRWLWGDEQSGLLMHTAATESASLCARMKSWLLFWNSNRRFDSFNSIADNSGFDQ